ncbi:GDSL-type esterase/lipase family protein [Coraliomargarita algicola]|uniref:GDSL-type esterase/lipase family protein n=1 Tax=Coraliomargarita algicola TaxID=3092156 RepID=A0ABZ0RGB3_9BACT|nr:GDSL-type esterase/lipase family protein [Coraliomargarita sp. J2-16]WPJ95126.1 GDSL-type esterase/lipase family protein [Coraliomargarita sp. J2-16]
MMKFLSIFICLMSMCGSLHASPPVEITVLALGDSITEGGEHFVCYRKFLSKMLKAQRMPYTFIGPKKDSDSAHAGYSGKNTAYLASIIEDVYRQYPADVVLLHSGHNSFSKDKPVPGILRDTDSIVRTIIQINPRATILIAQVITAGKLPKYDYIPELNKKLADYVKYSEFADNMVLVDQDNGFDWTTDTVGDKVHPNVNGAKKMAAHWLEGIKNLSN